MSVRRPRQKVNRPLLFWSVGVRVWGWEGLSLAWFRFSVSGFRVSGFGFRVSGLGSRVSGSGSRVSGLGFWVSGVGHRVSGVACWVSGVGCRVSSLRFRGQSFRVSRLVLRGGGGPMRQRLCPRGRRRTLPGGGKVFWLRSWSIGSGCGLQRLVCRAQDLGLRVQSLGSREHVLGIVVEGVGSDHSSDSPARVEIDWLEKRV